MRLASRAAMPAARRLAGWRACVAPAAAQPRARWLATSADVTPLPAPPATADAAAQAMNEAVELALDEELQKAGVPEEQRRAVIVASRTPPPEPEGAAEEAQLRAARSLFGEIGSNYSVGNAPPAPKLRVGSLADAADQAEARLGATLPEAEARQLFDNMVAYDGDRWLRDRRVRAKSLRVLTREMKALGKDIDALQLWFDSPEGETATGNFFREEEELLNRLGPKSGRSGGGEYEAEPRGERGPSEPARLDRVDPRLLETIGGVPEELTFRYQTYVDSVTEEELEDEEQQALQREQDRAAEAERTRALRERAQTRLVREVDEHGASFATGKKKSAIAQVQLRPGNGTALVNGQSIIRYFPAHMRGTLWRPLRLISDEASLQYDIIAKVKGGGLKGQLDAIMYGLAKCVQKQEPAHRPMLKEAGLLTRDSRKVERKKAGRKKARKRFTFVKR